MTSRVTSFAGMFSGEDDLNSIERVEIPLLQRDYAQGRPDDKAKVIRTNFVQALHDAVTEDEPIGLDFIYGEIRSGTLQPLDGQQRLTTLFLLHWYLASRTGNLGHQSLSQRFTYATRASARMFCERLVEHAIPEGVDSPADWIKDQAWYLYVWQHDPTVQSMLVMIEAIHKQFRDADLVAAWDRLTNLDNPAVTFHLLPIEDMGSAEDLYIKMNSRGKPLTEFEDFKARFEALLEKSVPARSSEFADRIDGPWSNWLWAYRGDDNIIDDEFMRYFRYITELCEWRDGRPSSRNLEQAVEASFGPENAVAVEHLDFLFKCFDTWKGVDIRTAFHPYLTKLGAAESGAGALLVFDSNSDLLAACLDRFGGNRRDFTYAQGLLLYAVLLHRIHETSDFSRRLRVVRNLIAASEDELRPSRIPGLVSDVRRIVVEGSLEGVTSFNQVQVDDELAKRSFLEAHHQLEASVFALEDHRLLRGSLVAFDLDPATFDARAKAFTTLMADSTHWLALTGALLAVGDYSRKRGTRLFRFGSPQADRWWTQLLTGSSRAALERTRQVLAVVLDRVANGTLAPEAELELIRAEWLAEREEFSQYDWRSYFVKYPAMREGASGLYASETDALGYSVCMLDKMQMNSHYRDAYLHAVARASGKTDAIERHWFTGYASDERWMRLEASGTMMRCVPEGFTFKPPTVATKLSAFQAICAPHGIGADLTLAIPQKEVDGFLVDTEDRVQAGAACLKAMVDAGL